MERFTSLQRTLCDYVPAYDAKWLGLQLITIEGDEELPLITWEEAEEKLARPLVSEGNIYNEEEIEIYVPELKNYKAYGGVLPVVQEILKETQGKLFYKEQFYEICHRVLGVEYEEAVQVFRMVTDRKKPITIATIKEIFEKQHGEQGVELFNFLYENALNLIPKGYIVEKIQLEQLKN